jgi:septin family protein
LSTDRKYISQLTTKRYQRYLKEEEKKNRNSKWIQDIVAAILMLIKLVTNALEKANVKRKRVVEKVSIE